MRSGLDDVVAAETALSDVDGLAGRLIIRGHSLDELAGRASAEDVLALLLDGCVRPAPTPADSRARRGPRRGLRSRSRRSCPSSPGCPSTTRSAPLVARLPDDDIAGDRAAAGRGAGRLRAGRAAPAGAATGADRARRRPPPRRRHPAHAARPPADRRPRRRRSTPISSPSPITASTPRPSPPASSPRRRPA